MSLAQNYTVRPHSYLWRADGSSGTQGTGSILNYPTLVSGTATATLSQVTSADVPALPGGSVPGTGSFIKVAASGGASGGNINVEMNTPVNSQEAMGNFGVWFYDPVGGNTDITGATFYLVNNSGFTKFFIFNGNGANLGASGRTKGWNLLSWRRDDQTTIGGAYTYAETSARMMLRVSLAANKAVTFYVGDVLAGYYTKPQIMVWAADNGAGAYDVMFPYMQARGMVGSYAPTTDYLAAPTGSQITAGEISEMHAAGWTVIPHQTIGTPLTGMTEAQMRTEIETVLAVHASYGWRFPAYYYPAGGASNALSDQVYASYGIKYGNNANTGNLQKGMPTYGGAINPYAMWSYTADGKTPAQVAATIDHAVKYGTSLGLLWHTGDGADEATFKASIDYLYRLREANVLDVVNYETFFKRMETARKERS